MDVERATREYIISELLYEEESATLSDDESLFARRAIDSIGLLKLVGFLETTYDIQLLEDELVPENLETIRAIGQLVRRKLASSAQP
jgi:acyl carrier protein